MGSRAEPPEIQGFWAIKLLSDEHAFYTLFDDNGRSPIGVGSRSAEHQEAQGFWATLNNSSDEHAFIPYLVTLVGREFVWGPGAKSPRKFRGLGR